MSKKYERLSVIENSILPTIKKHLSEDLVFDKAYTVSKVHDLLASYGFVMSKRNVRRDLTELFNANIISQCERKGVFKYYVESRTYVAKVVGNISPSRTLVMTEELASQASSSIKGYPQRLTEDQANLRFIEKQGYLALVPNAETKAKVILIKKALCNQCRLSFTYEKHANNSASLKEVNPIGIINDCGKYLLVATNKGDNTEHTRQFHLAKINKLTIHEDQRLFPQISNEQANEILLNGSEDYPLFGEQLEDISLRLTKDAAYYFAANKLEGSHQWLFNWQVCESGNKVAKLSFKYPISVNFIKGLLAFGSSIQVLKSDILKKAMTIQVDVNPYQRKLAIQELT